MENYLDPSKRHDFIFLFDVNNGNPNGDPDSGNMPRIDPETNHGFVTDVALKRKVRDYVAMVQGKEIFIQSKTALNSLYFQAMKEEKIECAKISINNEELLSILDNLELSDEFDIDTESRILTFTGEAKKKKEIMILFKENQDLVEEDEKKLESLAGELEKAIKTKKTLTQEDRDNIKERLCRKYFDIRMFGAVLTAGTNAGQVRGPVQLTFAKSIAPILPMDITITRVAITRTADKRKKQTEMGRKAIVPYGLYCAHGFYNPKLAERLCKAGNPITKNDLEILWEALYQMFEYDRSASRGEMACRGLYIFTHTHENGLGNAPAHKLFEKFSVGVKNETTPARSFADYEVAINKNDMPEGIELKEIL